MLSSTFLRYQSWKKMGCSSKLFMVCWSALLFVVLGNPLQAADYAKLDQAVPGQFVLDLAPVFDFDGDGCLPSAGISRSGQQNPGLNTSGTITGDCRSSYFLNTSNTLHRYACTTSGGHEYCGHFFGLYFEKDQVLDYVGGGHRHDWEHAAVWTTDGVATHGAVSAHGDMSTRAWNDVPIDSSGHMKVVYHKDGALTHAFRFASSGETAENQYGYFVTPALISWYHLSGDSISNGEMRVLLNNFDYGSATIDMKASNFISKLNQFKPSGYPTFYAAEACYFTSWFSEESSSGQTCSTGYVVSAIKCDGRYCDNKSLKCCQIPGISPTGDITESYKFSEEGTNYYANHGKAVVGMRCTGSYCDNIYLKLRSISGVTGGWWTPWFSEEEGDGYCNNEGYAAGVGCSGSNCDDIALFCKQ